MNWIFQGNPDTFDVVGYLGDFDKVTWTVRQKHLAKEMSIGDRVYFWKSKGKKGVISGILASGTIVTLPRQMQDHKEAVPYWSGSLKEEEIDLRIWVDIDKRMLDSFKLITVDSLKRDPTLSNLRIFKVRNETNYKITQSEADQIDKYVTGEVPPFNVDSWVVESRSSAYKYLDKSAFLHRGTGVPIPIRSFFIDGEMSPGESKSISLVHNGSGFSGRIEKEASKSGRTRLFWDSRFATLLKEQFPYHHSLYSHHNDPDSKIVLRLERVSGFTKYEVSFSSDTSDNIINSDIEADLIEDRGGQTEGGTKYYYGKRYERNPLNRKEAIRIHGLNCKACGFSFERAYGEHGADYIEVHHVKPVHTLESEQIISPQDDLITVCSNCHRMIHRNPKEILTVETLRSILKIRPEQ